jgi:hypothetical protein
MPWALLIREECLAFADLFSGPDGRSIRRGDTMVVNAVYVLAASSSFKDALLARLWIIWTVDPSTRQRQRGLGVFLRP